MAIIGTTMALVLSLTPRPTVLAQTSSECFGRRATITGTRGPDKLRGTDGVDVIVALGGDDKVSAGGGNDFICGGLGADELKGEGGDDRIRGGGGFLKSFGGGGGDRLLGGPGNDVLETEPAVDYRYGGDLASGGEGNDSLVGDEGPNRLLGGPGDDSIEGHGVVYEDCDCTTRFADELDGGPGDDSMRGGPAEGGNAYGDIFVGGPGDDVLDGDGDGPAGKKDWVSYLDAPTAMTVDLLSGTSTGEGADQLNGIEHVVGSKHDDQLSGNEAKNQLEGGGGDDVAVGLGGRDRLTGDAGNDQLVGGEGSDVILDGAGGDTIDGGPGDEAFLAESGDDSIDGGEGNDELLLTLAKQPVEVDLSAGTSSGVGQDTLIAIENVTGSEFGDTIVGDDGPNVIRGATACQHSSDVDVLDGAAGADHLVGSIFAADDLSGGPGDDLFEGSGSFSEADPYQERFDGGEGIDTLSFADVHLVHRDGGCNGVFNGVDADLQAGTVTFHRGSASGGSASIAGVETLIGSGEDDSFLGDGFDNTFSGGAGDDRLDARGGTNVNDGGEGMDECNNPNAAAGATNCES